MKTLKIIDDAGISTSYILISITVSIKTSKEDEYVVLRIETKNETITYEIRPDTRFPDTRKIEQLINNKIETTSSNNVPFIISENLERDYIYIGDIDNDTTLQFTAHKNK